jgi:hypothetical protein
MASLFCVSNPDFTLHSSRPRTGPDLRLAMEIPPGRGLCPDEEKVVA